MTDHLKTDPPSPPADAAELSASASSDVSSDALVSKKQFVLMPPEEKLRLVERRAQDHEDKQEFDGCIQDLVRCVALTRLVFGARHLKLAQAHLRLAKAYMKFKGWGLQAQEHATLARGLLPSCSSSATEKLEVLLSIHLTHGGASLMAANLEEAESSFLESERLVEELHQHGDISQEEKTKTEQEISTGLYRVYKTQKRPDKTLDQCEKSLRLLGDGQPERLISVYRDMAVVEQDRGRPDRAVEHLSKAHAIAMSHCPEELVGAEVSHSLALALSAAPEPRDNDSAGQHFEQSLNTYKNLAGQQDPAFLTVQDDFCRFLVLSGQQEKCLEIQRSSLATKKSTFGDVSVEVADSLELIGSLEMTQGLLKQAHRTMTKCLQIQTLLFGPQHRRSKATQKAVDMLARAAEVAQIPASRGRDKTKPELFSTTTPSGNDESSMSDS